MSKAATDLKTRFPERGRVYRIAERLHVSPGLVSRWLAAKVKPSARYRGAIEAEFGIPWSDWDKPPRRQRAA